MLAGGGAAMDRDRVALEGLLREARAVVGEGGCPVPLVLWRLAMGRPGEDAALAAMAEIWVVGPVPTDDRPAPDRPAAR
jgi:hypothetical protein